MGLSRPHTYVISIPITKTALHQLYLNAGAVAHTALHFVFAFNVSVSANFITARMRYLTIVFDGAKTQFVFISHDFKDCIELSTQQLGEVGTLQK